MAEHLTDIEFATIVLTSMAEAERIDVCQAVLTSLRDPFVGPILLDAGHRIARHADALARSSLGAGTDGGFCRPEGAASASRPTSPRRRGDAAGGFSAQRGMAQ